MLNNTEILKVAEVVSQEKGIDKDIVMEALEESFEIIGKSKYGMDNNIKASIDRITGNISLSHIKDVVETVDPVLQSNQILLDHAKKYDANAEIGKKNYYPFTFCKLWSGHSQYGKTGYLFSRARSRKEKTI